MEDWKKDLLNALLSVYSQIHSLLKFTLFIVIVIGIWLLNDSTQFIRDYRISNKIDNIKVIEQIIQQPKIDSATKKKLQKLEYDIIQRESLSERLYLFFLEDIRPQITVNTSAGTEQKATTKSSSLNNGIINNNFKIFLHIFSSSWLGLIFFFFCIYWIYINRKDNIKLPLICMLMAVFNIIIFSLITLLFPKSEILLVNYLINALFYSSFQLIMVIILLPKIIKHQEEIIENIETKLN